MSEQSKSQQQQPNPPEDEGEKLVLNSPEEARTPRDFLLWAGVVVLAVMTVFSPALHGKFLWDDDRHVEQNRALRDTPGLGNIWTGHWTYFFSSPGERARVKPLTPQYYPVTHTSFWIEAQLLDALGRPLSPTLFHVTNMILHAAGAILLWFILRELGVPGAWVAAAFWALHPLQTESVAWISERKNVLAGALFFGSILAYLRAEGLGSQVSGFGRATRGDSISASRDPKPETRDPSLYGVALVLFVLALLSKSVACSMPAVMLLLIWWKRGRLVWQRDVLPLLPFFAIGFVLAMFTGWIERNYVGASGPEWDMSLVQHVLLAANAIWFYAMKLVAPVHLAFMYPRWTLSASDPLLWAGVAALVAVTAALFALRKRIGRGPLVAWLIFCGVLVPALGFFNVYPMRYSYVADHFQYLASPALVALLVAAAARIVGRMPATAGYAIAGLLLIALAGLTVRHAMVFASPLELWADTARKNPDNASVRYNHGQMLFNGAGDVAIEDQDKIAAMLEQATQEFAAATTLNPKHDRAWTAWGQVLLERHDAFGAMQRFDKAIALNPQNVDALIGRAQALHQLKNWPDALAAYQKALAEATEQKGFLEGGRFKASTIYQMLGKIHDELGNGDAALSSFKEAARIAPGAPAIHYDYGTALVKAGQRRAATRPASTQAGAATQGATTQVATTQGAAAATRPAATRPAPATPEQLAAAEQFAAAIRAAPDFIDARISLAELMLDVGNLQGAQNQLIAAARLNAAYPRLMEAAKRFDAGVRQAEAATRPATTQSTQPTPRAGWPSLPLPGTPARGLGRGAGYADQSEIGYLPARASESPQLDAPRTQPLSPALSPEYRGEGAA